MVWPWISPQTARGPSVQSFHLPVPDLRDVRLDPLFAAEADHFRAVIPLVRTQALRPFFGLIHLSAQQLRGCCSFRRPEGRGDLRLHAQAVAVFRQGVQPKTEPSLLAPALAGQLRLRIGIALVGGVAPLLAVDGWRTGCPPSGGV